MPTPVRVLEGLRQRHAVGRLEGLAFGGIGVHATWVGGYCTSMEMAGVSVTLHRLDGELTELLDRPADCAMFRAG